LDPSLDDGRHDDDDHDDDHDDECAPSPHRSRSPSLARSLARSPDVIDGLEVLDRLERIPSDANSKPLQEIFIEKVTIHANPFAN